jgi:uncharacterized protein YbjT (DUF2867 family)
LAKEVTMTTVLITGATGSVGSALVPELRRRGVPARAFVRDPKRAEEILGEGVDLAVGDLSEPESIRRALEGVERLFLACGAVPGQLEYETNAIDAAAAAGVQRIVKLSAAGAEIGSPLAFWDWHARIEQRLRDSGVPAVVLRPSTYMTNLLGSAGAVMFTGKLFVPAGAAKVAMVDPRDVAEAAAVALMEDGHEGETYVLTGPEAMTYDEIAARLSEATGHTVEFVDVTEDHAREAMLDAGMPQYLVDFLVRRFGALRGGIEAQTTDTVRRLTGREPRSLADFARDHAGVFGADDPEGAHAGAGAST